ncbi:MAG: transposase [Deltaproteobacteria bacterium]|nr:transposase [Deltaproteobacteria bacterium]
MAAIPKIPRIPDAERTPLVVALLEIIQLQQEQIQELRDEIARLKGQKPKPKIKPSKLEKKSGNKEQDGSTGKRPGSIKREKTKELQIHETVTVAAANVPKGSVRKGYEEFTIQGIRFQLHNTLYRRERWLTPDGDTIIAPLPEDVVFVEGHFDAPLVCYILSQYYHCHVTQPLILEQLLELGVDISAGQVNRIITEGKERFHAEKDEILRVGLGISDYVHVDDTTARHQGKNGHCTVIGNELFAWFESTSSKSRINFLELLRAGNKDYVLSSAAFDYMSAQKLPKGQMDLLAGCEKAVFEDDTAWIAALTTLGITAERHIRIATEGALLGSILEHEAINPDLVILSDDAGQFDVLIHALCWIHAERSINKLIGHTDAQREALAEVRTQVWELYAGLKAYREAPGPEKKQELVERFDEIFTTKTCYEMLNQALKRIYKNNRELLLVLDRPEIPLHNNAAETDIREYVKKRTISGSTRSDLGRRCRDTFASLKKTCRKLGVRFWEYLNDRVSGANSIPWLPDLMRERMGESPG